MIALLMLLAAVDVRYVAKVEPRSWQPIEPKDVEKLIEQKALDQLTKKGTMKLLKSGFVELKSGDYSLLIEGRFIEEAEKFSAYLTFGPGTKSNVPSFYVIDTADVGDRSPGEMQKIIVGLVERAAKRLNGLVDPYLSLPDVPAPVESEAVPIDFGPVEMPVIKQPTGAVAKLINVRNEDHDRFSAFAELQKYVFDQPAARAAIERCAISDPSAKLRAQCVKALAPVARTRLETQRFLLSAMRNDVDPEVLSAIAEVSKSFVGLSRKEAIATWLDVVSANGTPGEASDDIARLIAEENSVPNLELAVARCLNSEALVYGKRSACAQYLLPRVPKERRAAVIYRYLENVRVGDTGESNVMNDIEQHAFGRGSEPLDESLADLLQRIVLQPRLARAQSTIVYALRRHPKPTPQTIETFLQVVMQNDNPFFVFNSLPDLVRSHPEIKDSTLAQLKKFQASHTFMKRPGYADIDKELAESIARLEKAK